MHVKLEYDVTLCFVWKITRLILLQEHIKDHKTFFYTIELECNISIEKKMKNH